MRIDRLGKKQLLVCPSSEFHDWESLPNQCFKELKRLYELLSYGVRWHDTEQVRTFLIMEAFRNWLSQGSPQASGFTTDDHLSGDRTAWTSHFYPVSHLRRVSELVEEVHQFRDSTADEFKEVFEQWQEDKDKVFDYWVQEKIQATARRYIRGFEKQIVHAAGAHADILRNQRVSIDNAADSLLPGHETDIMLQIRYTLVKQGVEENNWVSKAWEFLQSEHFTGLSFVRIGAMMWATVAYRAAHVGQKKPPNKGFYNDLSFVRTYLPYCDAMFLDKEVHGIMTDKLMEPVASQYETRLFSLTKRDEFLAHLDELESSASVEHLELLDEVYGKAFLTPFTELYEDSE